MQSWCVKGIPLCSVSRRGSRSQHSPYAAVMFYLHLSPRLLFTLCRLPELLVASASCKWKQGTRNYWLVSEVQTTATRLGSQLPKSVRCKKSTSLASTVTLSVVKRNQFSFFSFIDIHQNCKLTENHALKTSCKLQWLKKKVDFFNQEV